MDDVRVVGGLDAVAELRHDLPGVAAREPAACAAKSLEPLAQRIALEQLHDQEWNTVLGGIHVPGADDVGAREPSRDPRLAYEPLRHLGTTRQVPVQDLDRDGGAEELVTCLDHARHTAVTDEAGQAVAAL